MTTLGLRDVLADLERTGEYRILRRAVWRERYARPTSTIALRNGLYVDTETTDRDSAVARIVELGAIPFTFDATGCIYDIGEPMSWILDPGVPIPADAVAVHGITDDDVRLQAVDRQIVSATLADRVASTALVIAHNSAYDRPIMEREFPIFEAVPWGCSFQEVPWERFGCDVKKLNHILQSACRGFRDGGHRAIDDCRAGIHVLATAMADGRSAMSYLIESARHRTVRLWADGSPIEVKNALKSRGYWPLYENGSFVCWYKDTSVLLAAEERAWLIEHGRCRPTWKLLNAYDRYSVRALEIP